MLGPLDTGWATTGDEAEALAGFSVAGAKSRNGVKFSGFGRFIGIAATVLGHKKTAGCPAVNANAVWLRQVFRTRSYNKLTD